jgi:hypothetical protein
MAGNKRPNILLLFADDYCFSLIRALWHPSQDKTFPREKDGMTCIRSLLLSDSWATCNRLEFGPLLVVILIPPASPGVTDCKNQQKKAIEACHVFDMAHSPRFFCGYSMQPSGGGQTDVLALFHAAKYGVSPVQLLFLGLWGLPGPATYDSCGFD